MASPYILPPWLTRQGADPAEAFVSAFRAGASVAVQKAQLAQQAEQAAMSAAIREQENQRDALRSQHKIAIEQAQHQAELGIRQQSLEIAQQRAVQTAKRAALSFQAQETYRRRVAAGEDARKVLLEVGPTMGMTGAAMASLAKAPRELMKPGAAQQVLDASGNPIGYNVVQTGPESYRYLQEQVDQNQPPSVTPIPGTNKSEVRHGSKRTLITDPKPEPDLYLLDLKKRLAEAKGELAEVDSDAAKKAIPRLEAAIAKHKAELGQSNEPTNTIRVLSIRKKE